jgi:DNA-binding NarL/FixJ family response regulator
VTPKRSIMPWQHSVERSASPPPRPRLVFARDDTWASEKRPAEPARILIVEDDYLVAMEVETALAEAGFDVVGIATTAEEAIALTVAQNPTLVVMDVRLAGKRDGIDAALQLFREHGIRCIFATAHYDENARARAQPAGPLGWLQKPYTMASLVEAVRRALSDLGDR